MQKAYSSVLENVLDFVNNRSLITCYNIDKKFRNVIRGSSRHIYQLIYVRFIESINSLLLEEGRKYLDLSFRKNGEVVFFVVDTRRHHGISVDPEFIDIIKANLNEFAKTCEVFNLEPHGDKFCTHGIMEITDNCPNYYKHIVGPCRVHCPGGVNVLAIQLHYFQYLCIDLYGIYDEDENRTEYNEYNVNILAFAVDFQKFVYANYREEFKRYSEYFLKKFIELSDGNRNQSQYFEEFPEDPVLLRDMKDEKEMKSELSTYIRNYDENKPRMELADFQCWEHAVKYGECECDDHEDESEEESELE